MTDATLAIAVGARGSFESIRTISLFLVALANRKKHLFLRRFKSNKLPGGYLMVTKEVKKNNVVVHRRPIGDEVKYHSLHTFFPEVGVVLEWGL